VVTPRQSEVMPTHYQH